MMVLIGIILLVASVMIAVIMGIKLSAPAYKGDKSDHFDGQKFFTPGGASVKGFKDVLKWSITREKGRWTKNYEVFQGPPPASTIHEGVVVTFINHSTFLIQADGLNILTDPVWSERCSPFSFAGPQRMRPPGIRFEDLPHIDVVLLSHNHYDHLDATTVKLLNKKFQPLFVVALGIGNYLNTLGINSVKELDWWEKVNVGVEVMATPAQHFTSRGLLDQNRTLWCGFTIKSMDKNMYFAGDSGYGSFFKEIGEKAGPFDVSFIPIGAYLPYWFMNSIHISPYEAVDVHRDVKSKLSLAMHFGTFPLADDGQGVAEKNLKRAIQKRGLKPDHFLIPDEGVAITF